MKVAFEADERWNFDRGGVMFWAAADGLLFRCMISRGAIRELFGGSGSREDTLQAFRRHRDTIESVAEALIGRGQWHELRGETFMEVQILSGRGSGGGNGTESSLDPQ